MLGVMIIFALMSIFYYDYNYYTGEDAVDDDDDDVTQTDAASDIGGASRINSISNGMLPDLTPFWSS